MTTASSVRQHISRMPSKPSTYVALVAWGVEAFTASPTLGSFAVHFGVAPALFFIIIWLAHWEGRNARDR